jgi:hypothetical protein
LHEARATIFNITNAIRITLYIARGATHYETSDRRGFDRRGFDRRGFDRRGFDRRGFDRRGFDRRGLKHQIEIPLSRIETIIQIRYHTRGSSYYFQNTRFICELSIMLTSSHGTPCFVQYSSLTPLRLDKLYYKNGRCNSKGFSTDNTRHKTSPFQSKDDTIDVARSLTCLFYPMTFEKTINFYTTS